MIRKYLESTMLKPDATKNNIKDLCTEAVRYGFYGVCINPWYTEFAASNLKGTDVKLVTVVGFPLGCNESVVKLREAEEAVKKGAHEVDMVINLAALKNNDTAAVTEEIKSLISTGAVLKVIVETGYLTDQELVSACNCIEKGGAHFAKTSTGFGPMGATVADVKFLRSNLPQNVGVKAAGNIKSSNFALELISAGADRLGTSSAKKIFEEYFNFKR